jgi:hypothetical protein
MTVKERNLNVSAHLNPDLLNNPRVSIQVYDRRTTKETRGLAEDITPYPVSPKIGPYIVRNNTITSILTYNFNNTGR